MKKTTPPKIAIIHDWLYGGGAEKVVEALHEMYPEAPIYTSYCSDQWRQKLNGKVVTGYLQKWPLSSLRKFLPVLRQRWFRQLDLSGFDIIISSSGNGEAKFVTKNDSQRHICYCHTPTHFYWRKYDEYLKNPGFHPKWLARVGLKLLLKPLRRRDYRAAQKVDQFIANSTHIQKDIKQYYGRDSIVIHPPIDTAKPTKDEGLKTKDEKSGYIMWGRHVPYKRFDLAIKACNQLGLALTIVGSGPETKYLRSISGPTISFTGYISSQEIASLAQSSQGFIFPAEEDFGIAPVEAMALGLPVIAYRSGGALDYIIPGKSGEFFEKQTVQSLKKALSDFRPTKSSYSPEITAKKFSKQNFKNQIKLLLDT